MNGMKVVVIAAVAVIPLGSVLHWQLDEYRVKREKERVTANIDANLNRARAATHLIDDCRLNGHPGRVEVRGKALIWDVSGDHFGVGDISAAQEKLPAELKPQFEDTQVTVFLVVAKHNVKRYDYEGGMPTSDKNRISLNRIPAYRVDLEVAVVYLPERKAVGLVRVLGDDPPERIKRTYYDSSPVFGDTVVPLARWVEARVRSPQLPPEEPHEDPKIEPEEK